MAALPTAHLPSSLGKSNFENYFTFAFQVTNILFLLLAIRYQHRISIKLRISVPMYIQLFVFTLTTVLTKVASATLPCAPAAYSRYRASSGGRFWRPILRRHHRHHSLFRRSVGLRNSGGFVGYYD